MESSVNRPEPLIVCAAIRYDCLIVAGPRHFDDVMRSQLRDNKPNGIGEQGFVDQYGKFYNRTEALTVAKAAGQINRVRPKTFPENELFSEDLY